MKVFILSSVVHVAVLFSLLPGTATARMIQLDPPGDRESVLDKAGLLSPEDKASIVEKCAILSKEIATPIVIVTINSMAEHGGTGMSIEGFAHFLFNDWKIGYAKINGQDWNTGILLLISRADRRARIELGAGWGHGQDVLCKRIMNEQIIPNFKQDKYSAGIVAGVSALDLMARGKPLPKRVRPWWHYALVVGMIGLTIFTVVSLIRRGSGGMAWVFWAAVLGMLWWILIGLLKSSASGGSGGSGGGGSFGGGFSGGGGASGSW